MLNTLLLEEERLPQDGYTPLHLPAPTTGHHPHSSSTLVPFMKNIIREEMRNFASERSPCGKLIAEWTRSLSSCVAHSTKAALFVPGGFPSIQSLPVWRNSLDIRYLCLAAVPGDGQYSDRDAVRCGPAPARRLKKCALHHGDDDSPSVCPSVCLSVRP